MLLLALDTSANMVSVALLDEDRVWGFVQEDMERGHAESLMPIIARLMENAQMTLKEIDGIAVSVGPGSFTGVRVGLAAARAFGLALKIPVYGVTCFESVVFGIHKPVAVVLDTKRDDFYVQFFDENAKACSVPAVQSAEQLQQKLPFTAVGSGALKLSEEIGCPIIQKISPIAVSVGKVALSRLDNPMPADPLYLRDADVTL